MANFKYLKVCHMEEISEFPKSVILRRDSSQLEISLKQAVILFSSRNLMILKVTVVKKDYVKITSWEFFKIYLFYFDTLKSNSVVTVNV